MLDYEELNFKCGLELHAQLETSKLFCRCPTIIDNNKPELTIRRKLRSVAGETGKKDIATLYEESKDKTFIYEYSNKYGCLVDIDCEPPSLMNQEALKIALEICLLLNAKIIPRIKVMRKIIIDGSNPSSYQRTTLIAKEGYIKTSKGRVRIPTIYLEEDAARKIKERGNEITYRIDRLGFPLVEISTLPDIKDPEHAKETAELIGMVLKSTGKVKSGIGTIRQDINLSIQNGARVELKGFQNLKEMPKVIEKEIQRQLELIKQRKKVQKEVRKVNSDNTTIFLRPLPGELRSYPDTDQKEYKIPSSLIKSIKLPELITEKSLKLEQDYNLEPNLAKEIIKNKFPFQNLTKKYSRLSPKLIAQILIEFPKDLKSRYKINYKYKLKDFETVFNLTNEHALQKEAILDILQKIAKKQKINPEDYQLVPVTKLKLEIQKIIEKDPNLSINAIMGLIMKKYSARVNPKTLIELIKNTI